MMYCKLQSAEGINDMEMATATAANTAAAAAAEYMVLTLERAIMI
jgi:hypothetical protein